MKTLTILRQSILYISFFVLIYSCDDKQRSEYQYIEGFSFYLSNVHKIDINNTESTIFYLIPISNSCESCIKLNLNLLSSLETNYAITPILIGIDKENNYTSEIQNIDRRFRATIFDKNESIYSYRTGFGKPILVQINKGYCNYFLEVSDFKIDEAKKYLEQ